MASDVRDTSDTTKREFLKKATYVVPAVLTLAAAPSFASAGSSARGSGWDRTGDIRDPADAYRLAWDRRRDDRSQD